MGLMQAVDIVSCLMRLCYHFAETDIIFNTKRIMMFGSSHGSYLAYLANAVCPGLFGCVIDISAYLTPYYMKNIRQLLSAHPKCRNIRFVIEQFLNIHPEYCYNEKLYDLRFLYSNMKNTCRVIAFQGTEDWMVNWEEKAAFIENLENAEIMLIGADDVDGVLCKDANHGLGMDFFKLFEMIMPMLDGLIWEKSCSIQLKKEVLLGDVDTHIKISYESGLPEVLEISK